MKKIIVGFIMLFVVACENGNNDNNKVEEDLREEIVEYYDTGDKYIVEIYKGEENNEENLIKRITYYSQNKGGGKSKEENYIDGWDKSWYENGNLKFENNYKGLHIVLSKSWYDNGQLFYEKNYKAPEYGIRSKSHGLHKSWYEDGQLKEEENYKDDKRDGALKSWYENGQLKKEWNYKNEKLDGPNKCWYENGNLSEEANYINCMRDGLYKRYYEDGRIMYETEFFNGDGIDSNYYENGQLRSVANYKEGAKEGLWEAWYNNGQKYIKGYYKTIIRYDPHIGMDKKHSIKDSLWNVWYKNGQLMTGSKKKKYLLNIDLFINRFLNKR